jgi:membrane dipeptidase
MANLGKVNAEADAIDFGLSNEQEERAARLHHECIVVDLLSQQAGSNIFAHYPTHLQRDLHEKLAAAASTWEAVGEAMYWPYEMSMIGKSDLIYEWFGVGGLTCGTYALSVYDGPDPSEEKWEKIISTYGNLPWVRYAKTSADIRQAKRDGAIAFYAQCQPALGPPRSLQAFDAAYAKGLRSFMLTYNRMDRIGVGCTERVDAGLSMFGVEVVKHCNALGIIVDVSHCGHLTTMDACRHSQKPVNANHTAAKAVFPHARCKSDEALRAIADTGGVIGVAAVPAFLTSAAHPSIEHMLDHIDYLARLVGWQHVAIGTDWPLQAPPAVLTALDEEMAAAGFRPEDRLDLTARLLGFDDCRDLPNITRGLVKRNYSDEQIRGILGENALRVFDVVWR